MAHQVKTSATRFLAALFGAGAVWRALVAFGHYRSSLAAADDPSIQELEQVSAAVETGLALLLLAHGGALLALSRRPLRIGWPYALAVAFACAAILSATLLGAPLFSWPGVYAASIVVSVSLLSHFLRFDWLSLYLGSLGGSVLACSLGLATADPFVCLFVVGPCVALAFLGAGLRLLVVRIAGAGRPG